ncbi:MAG: hypothetical protein LUH05_07940 [Candidatus Gastranaerophilales bacterium]|nr:hypothetical protein [Candidatus Gastranaerophilales bacterium]
MKRKKLIVLILTALLIQTAAISAPKGALDESKMKSSQIAEGMSVNKPEFDTEAYAKKYKKITKDGAVMQAMELMNTVSIGQYSYNALMGNNLTEYPFKIEFKNISEINPEYASFDALGWKKKNKLYIYINEKHRNAPPEAIAALLAHEAIHQDEFASLNEETYAWTLEAAVWMKLTEKNPTSRNSYSTLVERENMLQKLFEKGDYTNKYIKKAVYTNPGYKKLPTRSPGFEDEDL